MPKLRLALTACVLAGLLASVAAAQPTLTGIRATQTGTDPLAVTADLDVTVYTTPAPYGSPYDTGFLGDQYSGTFTFFGYTYNFLFRILDPSVDAIRWGDGSTVDRTTVPLVSAGSPRTFRGSFSHTYPAPGTYPVTVGAHGFMGYPDDGTYDNPQLPPVTGNAIYDNSAVSYYRISIEGYPGYTTTGTTTFAYYSPIAVALTNSLDVEIPTVLEIPTASESGLLVLALSLLAAGVAFLRR